MNPETLKHLYFSMLRIRRIEEAVAHAYPLKEMRCPIHLSIGQEATPVGVCAHLSKRDHVYSTHRCHAHYLAKGGSLPRMMAELYGKVTGCCHGKAGSMHLVDADQGMMGASALVAGTIPIATGSALAFSLAPETSDGTPEEPRVSVAFFGDGATEEGIFYESLGFAQLRRLPVIFVCENNLYATYSHQSARQATPFISQRGSSFGIPGHVVDGNDIAEIYKVAGHAVSRARRGDGPSLLEFRTTRWRDHVGPDLDVHVGFRTAEEVESAMRQCAILKAEKRLIENGWLMEDERQEFEHALAREIEDAFTFARAGAFPDGEEIFTDVYEISRGGMKNENTANT